MNTKNTKNLNAAVVYIDTNGRGGDEDRQYSVQKAGDEYILTDLEDDIKYYIPAEAIKLAEQLELKPCPPIPTLPKKNKNK